MFDDLKESSEVTQNLAVPVRTTFVLPGRNRSGGVRVTVEMANRLLELGYRTRIVCRDRNRTPYERVHIGIRNFVRSLQGAVHDNWLVDFTGPVEGYSDLANTSFEEGEVVIAVGSMVVPEVAKLGGPVHRVRFNHGIHAFDPERMDAAWKPPMLTMTVAKTLVPRLREFDGRSPIWVVPNGIDRDEYYPTVDSREGIGAVLSANRAKSLPDLIDILSQFSAIKPGVKYCTFGEGRRPPGVPRRGYTQLPPLAGVRSLYGNSRVWLLTSREEGLPGPVLEAMACGAVVVSSDNSGSCEIIRDGENGLLFAHGDREAAVKQLVRVWDDPGLREKLVQGGFATAERFSWGSAVTAMRQSLADIVRGEERYAVARQSDLK